MLFKNNKKRILVTGGAGFLGSNLVNYLLQKGHSVICVDNLSTGSIYNIKHLLSHPNFKFLQHDISDPLDIKVDEIFNLACPASPIQYQSDAVATAKTALLGTINMLELAKQLDCKILQASTSEIYGEPAVHPQVESYWGNVNPIGVRACYTETKRAGEALCSSYHSQYGVKIKIARIFNTYGPNMHPNDGRVVSNFIMQALENKPITIYGDGNQTRSFCFVSDLIRV